MALDLSAYDEMMPKAIRHFWMTRREAASRQKGRGVSDKGNRGAVTAGKNMDGFVEMISRIIYDNGRPLLEQVSGDRIGFP